MNAEKQSSPMFVSFGAYVVQFVVVFAVVLHAYDNKDTAIVISFLIAIYGMITAQNATESAVSGMRFLSLMRRLERTTEIDAEVEEFAKREGPYALAHALFGFAIALIGVAKLAYILVI